MFKREDFWPFMFGVFILGGLLVIPAIWSQFSDIPLDRLVLGSVLGCFIFAYAHDRDGGFSVLRLIVGYAIVFVLLMKGAAKGGLEPIMIPGGALGFLVMAACGWVGILFGRAMGLGGAPIAAGDEHEEAAEDGSDLEPVSAEDLCADCHSLLALDGPAIESEGRFFCAEACRDSWTFKSFAGLEPAGG